MGKRALLRKLQSIGLNTRRKIIGGFAVIAAIIWWVAEQYAGGLVTTYISEGITQLLVSTFSWGKEHPGQISMMIFFLSLSYLVVQLIHDTSTVIEIPVYIDKSGKKIKGELLVIGNNTEEDLVNCTIDLLKVDDTEKSSVPLWYDHAKTVDIMIGKDYVVDLGDLLYALAVGYDANQEQFIYDEKQHVAELLFRGNTLKNETKSIRIWVQMVVEKVGVDLQGKPMYKVFADKVETAKF